MPIPGKPWVGPTARAVAHGMAHHGSTMARAMRTPPVLHETSPTACHGSLWRPRFSSTASHYNLCQPVRRNTTALTGSAIRGKVCVKRWKSHLVTHRKPWQPTANHGKRRQHVVSQGNAKATKPWQAVARRGKLWQAVASRGNRWQATASRGKLLQAMEAHRKPLPWQAVAMRLLESYHCSSYVKVADWRRPLSRAFFALAPVHSPATLIAVWGVGRAWHRRE